MRANSVFCRAAALTSCLCGALWLWPAAAVAEAPSPQTPVHSHAAHAMPQPARLGSHAPSTDAAAVRAVLMHTWDQPGAPLKVHPVVVQGRYAIAGWQQGERGGRALLVRSAASGHWAVTLCAGDGLKDPALLRDAGVAPAQAQALLHSLKRAERGLSPAERARLASFDGLLRMDDQGRHPPQGHGEAQAHLPGGH
jgi:hypothetical protein